MLYLKIRYRDKANTEINSLTVLLSLTQASLCFPRRRISPGLTGMKGTGEILHTIQCNAMQCNAIQYLFKVGGIGSGRPVSRTRSQSPEPGALLKNVRLQKIHYKTTITM